MDNELDKFVVMIKWIDGCIDDLTIDQMKEVAYGVLMYGLYEEQYAPEDAMAKMALKFIFPQIEIMQNAYQRKVSGGENGGKKAKLDPLEVWQLAQQIESGAEIARKLGVPKTTLYSNEGWKQRTNKNYGAENGIMIPNETETDASEATTSAFNF